MNRSIPDIETGRVLAGRYRIEATIGAGGMGVVYRALDIESGTPVAVKVLDHGRSNITSLEQRFAREVAAIQRLTSPHAVRLLDAGTLGDGSHFMVMEYLEGSDLHRTLKISGPLPVGRAVKLITQACHAIGEAHALGIIHRDIKPANLFVTTAPDGDDCLKVLDFGISKLPQATIEELALTGTGTILGSPVYMSPEQMTSSKNVDARTDIWALGMVLYQLLSGKFPYEAEGLPELCAKVLTHEPQPLSHLVPVPSGLEAVVMRCLERKADRRYPAVADLVADLAPFTGLAEMLVLRSVLDETSSGTAIQLGTPPPVPLGTPAPEVAPPARSSRIIWLGGAVVGVTAGVAFLVLSWSGRAEPARKAPTPAVVETPPPAPPPAAVAEEPPPAAEAAPPPAAPAVKKVPKAKKKKKPPREKVPASRGEFDSPLPP